MKDDLHVMIDLETLALTPDAVVTQLGWAVFALGNTGVGLSGCYHLQVPSQMVHNRRVDWSTIQWWMEQDEDMKAWKISATALRGKTLKASGRMG